MEKVVKYFVADLQTVEECESLESARELAKDWLYYARQNAECADREALERMVRIGDRGLESGDIEIYVIGKTEDDWSEISDAWAAIRDADVEETLSGYAETVAVAVERGIIAG